MDPYRLYNGLGEDYRPLGQPDAAPRPPRFPERVRAFLYACGAHYREQQRKDMQEVVQALSKMMRG
jgi:hypothetical protein